MALTLTERAVNRIQELRQKRQTPEACFRVGVRGGGCSGLSYFVNQAISSAKYKGKKEFDFEEPLMRLIWIAACLCISTSFIMSYLLISDLQIGRAHV